MVKFQETTSEWKPSLHDFISPIHGLTSSEGNKIFQVWQIHQRMTCEYKDFFNLVNLILGLLQHIFNSFFAILPPMLTL